MGALNARISLRYDTHENWSTASGKAQVLNKGEIGICAINPEGLGQPYVMFKVGDGATTFENLPWSAGLAADVFDWAKEAGIYVESTEGSIVSNIFWDDSLNNGLGGIKVSKYDPVIETDDYAANGVTTEVNGNTLVFTPAATKKAVKSIKFE